MKNVSHSPVTEMLSGKYKIWLIVGLVLLPIADLSACIVLWVFGAAGSYWGLPLLMTVVDLLYLLAVVLSNQRFKYAQKLFFAYIVVTIVFVIIWLAKFAGNPVIFGNTALSAWGLLHIVGIAAVGISYLYASRRVRVGRPVQMVLAIAFSAVALLACAIFYGVAVVGDGYFGQGSGTLPLAYTYTDNDECMVTDVVYGRGDSVVVPYEFNGRKVTSVSAKLFTYGFIKSVTLNCDPDVELCADKNSGTLNTNIKIYVDKKDVDTIKQKLYNRDSGYYARYRHELGNNVEPIGLDKDEVFVKFKYNHDAYDSAQGKIIPTWYGKKGDTFNLSDIEGVDYAEHSDANNDDDLYYCYNNVGSGGGFIMSALKDVDGKALDGVTVNESRGIPVSFQKIYKVFAGISNDDMYHTEDHFSFSTVNGVKRDYKLTVLDKADELLEPFDRGEAFTRTMQYAAYGSQYYKEFTSLSKLLGEGYGEVTIAPYWELAKPEITLSRVNDAAIIYGDDYALTASVTHPIDGIQVEYEWYDDVQRIGYEQDLQMHASTTGMLTYTAIVKISAPAVTSRTSGNAAEIKVYVNKRPITVKWRMEGGGDVYDGNPRQILNEVENAADGETVTIRSYTRTGHAGTFTENAEFVDLRQEQNYTIKSGASYTYTIKPYIVPLTWDEQTEFVYDGKKHRPEAHATDLAGAELAMNYTGTGTWVIDAGEYSVTAELQTTNYKIDDASKKTVEFKITPKKIAVLWDGSRLTYNGNVQAPKPFTVGSIDDENVAIDVTGGQTNANVVNGNVTTTYIATAASANKNYTLTGQINWEYTIEPYGVTVNWTNTTVTYNGRKQLPNASATGVNNQVVSVTVSLIGYRTGATNADSYTATATLADTNYTITSNRTHAFTISKMNVSVEWGDSTLTYNGQEQTPTATAKGANGEDLPLTVSGGRRNAGSGTATAAFASEQQNYTLIDINRSFSIALKNVKISIENVTAEYGETPAYEFTATGIVDGDAVTLTCSVNYVPDGDGNIPADTYNIIVGAYGTDSTNYSYTIVKSGTLTVTPPTQTEE